MYLNSGGPDHIYALEILEMRRFSKRNSTDENLGWDMRILESTCPTLPAGTRVSDSIPLYGKGADAALRVVPAFFLAMLGQDPDDKALWTKEFLESINATIVDVTEASNPMRSCKLRARTRMQTLDSKFSTIKVVNGVPQDQVVRINYGPYLFGTPGLV